MMLQNSNVFRTMTAVRHALDKEERSGNPRSTLVLDGSDPNVFGTAGLRRAATITAEVHSGSDRPLVGPAIRYAKRGMRRGLRWYVTPVTDQQSNFNNRLIDVVEKLTVRQERLAKDVEELREEVVQQRESVHRLLRAIEKADPEFAFRQGSE